MEAEPSEYVEPELLELAWSVCAESDVAAFSPKSILSIIDRSSASRMSTSTRHCKL